jgi:hypothetical protein
MLYITRMWICGIWQPIQMVWKRKDLIKHLAISTIAIRAPKTSQLNERIGNPSVKREKIGSSLELEQKTSASTIDTEHIVGFGITKDPIARNTVWIHRATEWFHLETEFYAFNLI